MQIKRNLISIVAVAILASLFSACSSTPANKAGNTTKAANTAPKVNTIPPNAPPGAQPPNQAGASTATVVLEEFADFQCGSCALKHPVLNEVKSMYGSRIRFVFRNFPLDMHDKAHDAAVAADAAGMQGKFWDMQNILFNNQAAWTADANYKQTWKGYADKIGLDVAKWEADMLGIAVKARVEEDKKRAKAIGVTSTPTLYINGVEVPFAQMTKEGLKTLIDAELQKTTSTQAAPAAANTATSNK
ncbi:MAG: DsbA family protein [Pyrinomonadaceae bacterium]